MNDQEAAKAYYGLANAAFERAEKAYLKRESKTHNKALQELWEKAFLMGITSYRARKEPKN